jgi:uncharacterized protein
VRGPEFEWDESNIAHIAKHGVAPQEVELAATGCHVRVPVEPKNGEERWRLYGKAGDRWLVVIYTMRNGKFRAVTAYTMNRKERNLYASKITEVDG